MPGKGQFALRTSHAGVIVAAMGTMPEEIEAEPIRLVRCRLRHLDDLMAAIEQSRPELANWLPWADPMPSVEAEREFLAGTERDFGSGAAYGYFLFEADGQLVGGCGLTQKDDHSEIGYWVRSDRTGRGYATAAAAALKQAWLEHLPDIPRLVIRVDEANAASAAIPPKLGLRLLPEREAQPPQALAETGTLLVWAAGRR